MPNFQKMRHFEYFQTLWCQSNNRAPLCDIIKSKKHEWQTLVLSVIILANAQPNLLQWICIFICSWNEILQTREETLKNFFNLKVSPKIGCLKDSIVEDFYKTLRILCKSWKTNHLPQMLTTKEAILVNLCKLLPKESN